MRSFDEFANTRHFSKSANNGRRLKWKGIIKMFILSSLLKLLILTLTHVYTTIMSLLVKNKKVFFVRYD